MSQRVNSSGLVGLKVSLPLLNSATVVQMKPKTAQNWVSMTTFQEALLYRSRRWAGLGLLATLRWPLSYYPLGVCENYISYSLIPGWYQARTGMSFLKAESAAGSVKLWRSLVVRDSKGWREVQVSSNSCCCVQLFSIWPAVCPVTTLAYYETRCCELTENQCFPQNNSLHFPIIACWPANLTGNWKLDIFYLHHSWWIPFLFS